MAEHSDEVQAWLASAATLQRAHARSNRIAATDQRDAMAQLWRLTRSAPLDLRHAYRNLDEKELAPTTRDHRDALTEGRLLWTATGDWKADALSIGGQLRALDAELATRPDFARAPASPQSFFCQAADAWVVPRGRPKPTDRRPGPGNGFGRRGTPHHRILPRLVLGKYEVELHWSHHLSFGPTAGEERVLGAALLPGLAMDWDETAGSRVMAANCTDEAKVIQEQVDGAFSGSLLACVWPELTMPPERLERLQAALDDKSVAAAPLAGPALIAAGSWHEADSEAVRNVMRVLDKSGRERLRFVKISTFVGGGFVEANAPGLKIPVLLNQEALVTFAICSDFCDLDEPIPYAELDVDLILVPSLGKRAAMNGHEANARVIGVNPGATTFVVQQHLEGSKPLGWVLPTDAEHPSLEEEASWSTRRMTFR
jgi:hypothetical protein